MRPSPSADPASEDQLEALRAFDSFLTNRNTRVFVLSGAAGTGKTTLLRQMVTHVESLQRRPFLTALTGRAATIARARTGRDASTLHSFLYSFDTRSSKVVDGVPKLVFSLRNPSADPVSVLFVDEVSMLGATSQGELETMRFGSGNLAADLLDYLFGGLERAGDPPKLVLIGDPYQLPPVGDPDSVALSTEGWDRLTGATLGQPLPTVRVLLTTVHRQGEGGVLDLATRYRDALIAGDFRTTPRPSPNDPEVAVDVAGGRNVSIRAAEIGADPHSQVVITYTNAVALAWNRLVRQERWGDPESPVRPGDVLVNTRRDPRTQLDNGEILGVERAAPSATVISHLDRRVRLRQVVVRATTGGPSHEALIVDNALDSEERTLAREDSQVLWVEFSQQHRGLRDGTPEFWDAAYRDPILNPIVAKYGYALTCHKAQGGQWDRVLVDFSALKMAPDSVEGFRWAYTAITRARERLVLIDPPYRSPFSRLASTGPVSGSGTSAAESAPGQSSNARRSRAERAVQTWAHEQGFEIGAIDRKDYNTRYEISHDGRAVLFDVYFNAGGFVTKRLPVRAGESPTEAVMPPLSLLEQASFDGMPRPSDPRIESELSRIEEALDQGGLAVDFRQAAEWSVELAVGDEHDMGVLVLSFRKTGVFSALSWKRPPGGEIRRRVAELLDRLADG